MRFFISLGLILGFAQASFAQVGASDSTENIQLENGYTLEITPAKYQTFAGETPEHILNPPPEWIVIPATFEMITETEIVQAAYTDLKVISAELAKDGSVLRPTQLSLEEVPAITREVTRRIVKTPSRVVKRSVPVLYHPPAVRKQVQAKLFVLRDAEQVEIGRYEDPEEILAAIEALD